MINYTRNPGAMLMRMPRPRFTVRRFMVSVIICALMIEGGMVWQRSSKYGDILLKHQGNLEIHHWNRDTVYIRQIGGLPDYSMKLSPDQEARRACFDPLVEYEEQMVRKYRRAIFFPWLSVKPDPPEPK
jgi:hypothetical protein